MDIDTEKLSNDYEELSRLSRLGLMIDGQNKNLRWAHHVTHEMHSIPTLAKDFQLVCELLGVRKIPELYVVNSPGINCGSLNAGKTFLITTGLLECLDRKEIKAVLGHEAQHVRPNEHVLRRTLLALAAIASTGALLGYVQDTVDPTRSSSELSSRNILFQAPTAMLALLLAVQIMRQKEFDSDIAGARVSSPESMTSALKKITPQSDAELLEYLLKDKTPGTQGYQFALTIYSIASTIKKCRFLAPHPTLEERLKSLEQHFSKIAIASGDETASPLINDSRAGRERTALISHLREGMDRTPPQDTPSR